MLAYGVGTVVHQQQKLIKIINNDMMKPKVNAFEFELMYFDWFTIK